MSVRYGWSFPPLPKRSLERHSLHTNAKVWLTLSEISDAAVAGYLTPLLKRRVASYNISAWSRLCASECLIKFNVSITFFQNVDLPGMPFGQQDYYPYVFFKLNLNLLEK